MPQDMSQKDVKIYVGKGCQKRISEDAPERMSEDMSEDMSEEMSQRTSLLNGLYWTPGA